ncbi:MAG TPA: 5-oxoprolinase subunit PxpA [Kofleriaceae bacterium]
MALMNLDAGEYPDEPEALWALFDVLNIACGGHAGDAASMARVVAWCVAHGAAISAHPSYPDREGFGRRSLAIAPDALAASLGAQCEALVALARGHGRDVAYVKPHGALYHDANARPELAEAVIGAARAVIGDRVIVVGPPGGELARVAAAHHLGYAVEGFADRRMRADGSLVPRGEANALLTDPAQAAAQALALAARVATICVHADTPGALAIAGAVHEALHG